MTIVPQSVAIQFQHVLFLPISSADTHLKYSKFYHVPIKQHKQQRSLNHNMHLYKQALTICLPYSRINQNWLGHTKVLPNPCVWKTKKPIHFSLWSSVGPLLLNYLFEPPYRVECVHQVCLKLKERPVLLPDEGLKFSSSERPQSYNQGILNKHSPHCAIFLVILLLDIIIIIIVKKKKPQDFVATVSICLKCVADIKLYCNNCSCKNDSS